MQLSVVRNGNHVGVLELYDVRPTYSVARVISKTDYIQDLDILVPRGMEYPTPTSIPTQQQTTPSTTSASSSRDTKADTSAAEDESSSTKDDSSSRRSSRRTSTSSRMTTVRAAVHAGRAVRAAAGARVQLRRVRATIRMTTVQAAAHAGQVPAGMRGDLRLHLRTTQATRKLQKNPARKPRFLRRMKSIQEYTPFPRTWDFPGCGTSRRKT